MSRRSLSWCGAHCWSSCPDQGLVAFLTVLYLATPQVDEQDRVIGTERRSVCHAKGLLHRAVSRGSRPGTRAPNLLRSLCGGTGARRHSAAQRCAAVRPCVWPTKVPPPPPHPHPTPPAWQVYCWVFSPTGELLVQRRSPHKRIGASCWDLSVAEHLQLGETYRQVGDKKLHADCVVPAELNIQHVGQSVRKAPAPILLRGLATVARRTVPACARLPALPRRAGGGAGATRGAGY